jgi:hypothetical protein
MTLKTLIEQLSKELELPALVPDNTGKYHLVFDEDQTVSFYELNSGIVLYSELAKCPVADLEAFFTDAMLANLFGQGTSRAVLGLTADGKTLTLSFEIDYNIEYKDFRDLLEDFLNAADVWRTEALKTDRS